MHTKKIKVKISPRLNGRHIVNLVVKYMNPINCNIEVKTPVFKIEDGKIDFGKSFKSVLCGTGISDKNGFKRNV
jgi:hypothetical protein